MAGDPTTPQDSAEPLDNTQNTVSSLTYRHLQAGVMCVSAELADAVRAGAVLAVQRAARPGGRGGERHHRGGAQHQPRQQEGVQHLVLLTTL